MTGLGEDIPSDKLDYVSHVGVDFGFPYCHQGDIPDPKFGMGHKCSDFTPPAFKLGPHMAPLGMKFYTGNYFPADYKDSIIVAEHGSWNRLKYQGARPVRINVDPDGKNAKQEEFASGWLDPDNNISADRTTYWWRKTARCWSPTISTAPSTGSAIASSRATIQDGRSAA